MSEATLQSTGLTIGMHTPKPIDTLYNDSGPKCTFCKKPAATPRNVEYHKLNPEAVCKCGPTPGSKLPANQLSEGPPEARSAAALEAIVEKLDKLIELFLDRATLPDKPLPDILAPIISPDIPDAAAKFVTEFQPPAAMLDPDLQAKNEAKKAETLARLKGAK